jgi:uncharacterized membrane protein YdjX (TVP38/TMEM64 family)
MGTASSLRRGRRPDPAAAGEDRVLSKHAQKLAVAGIVAVAIAGFFWLDLGQYLSLEALRTSQQQIAGFVAAHQLSSMVGFFLLYVGVTALSIPGAAVMTLAAGAVFGLLTGTILVSFASSIGATLAFLLSRFLLRDYVEQRFGWATAKVNAGVEAEGGYYLFTLRLVPLFPFFVINLAMGLTRLKTSTFYWVSQAGMLAGTVVYVNAGTQLARIQNTGDILSPALIGSFVLLGIFPLLAKKSLEVLRRVRTD